MNARLQASETLSSKCLGGIINLSLPEALDRDGTERQWLAGPTVKLITHETGEILRRFKK